ncbi:diguanylate cyclase [Porticoccaceae bacterium LTM1]|nr:diguanylate cyclase [Porticoccaceae bacterium LTM1]
MLSNYSVTTNNLQNAKVLIVDDQPINLEIMIGMIGDLYQTFTATSGEQAMELVAEINPDLILMDVMLEGIDGIETCRRLKANEHSADIPIMFITSIERPEEEDLCWRAGAVDFLNKPVSVSTLLNRIKAQLTLKWQNDLLRKLACMDGLTGVYNRRYFDMQLEVFERQFQREGEPLSVLIIDIDHFKRYNDTHGHLEGDDCLKRVAELLSNQAKRPVDVFCRYGGEEFVVLMPKTPSKGAVRVAERMLSVIRDSKEFAEPISISIGVSSCYEENDPIKQMLHRADQALYQAKKEGRDQYAIYHAEPCEKITVTD